MLRIVGQRDDVFLLRDHQNRHVGSVRDRTVRFNGFVTPLDAVAAVIGGGNALAAYLGGTTVLRAEHDIDPAGSRSRAAAPDGDDPLRPVRLAHDGTHEWVVLGGRRVARLVAPSDTRQVGDATDGAQAHASTPHENGGGEFAIEFVLPDGVGTSASLTLAQVLYAAVRVHRARAAFARPSRVTDVAPPPVT